jgi:hypothetical protein
MISQHNNKPLQWISLGMSALALAGVAIVGSGCGEQEQPPVQIVQNAPAPPPPPPPPAVTPIEQLMVDLNIDRRVVLPEDKAPSNNADRKAVLEFYDAMARGNERALRTMLAETDKRELDALVESGAWKDTTSRIKRINVQTGTNSLAQNCALAVIEVASGSQTNFQPQLWYYTVEDETPNFEAAPTPPGIMDRLSGPDWIAAWHTILAEELALADKPETDYEVAQKNLDQSDDSSAPLGGGGAPGPGGGPAPIGRPPPPPISPPGIPGGPGR